MAYDPKKQVKRDAKTLFVALKRRVTMASPLSIRELASIEDEMNAPLPDLLMALLRLGAPVGGFASWRKPEHFSAARDAVHESIVDCVRYQDFWLPSWGEKPKSVDASEWHIRKLLQEAPPLLHLYSHRFLPLRPALPGNPVFSLVGTDIVAYSPDLFSYLVREFRLEIEVNSACHVGSKIDFWSDFDPPTRVIK